MNKPIVIFDSNHKILAVDDKVKVKDFGDKIFEVTDIISKENGFDIEVKSEDSTLILHKKPRTSMNYVVFNDITCI